jgi:hypothetical protein
MPYCSQCGVEVDSYVDACPLCSTPLQKITHEKDKKKPRYPDKPSVATNNGGKGVIRFLAWEIVSVSLLTALLIVFLTNVIVDFKVTWAWYPMASLVLVWLLATFPLLLNKRPLLIPVLSAAAILSFLASLDLIDNGAIDWFHKIALPIFILLLIVATAVILVGTRVKKKGFNIAAFILFGIGLVAAGLDAIINYFLYARVALSWSLFVIIPILFTAIFLLYIHYRLVKAVDLKKWFQL